MTVGIRCGKCGQTSDMVEFLTSPMGLELPKNHYQCPLCHTAFKIEKCEPRQARYKGRLSSFSSVVGWIEYTATRLIVPIQPTL